MTIETGSAVPSTAMPAGELDVDRARASFPSLSLKVGDHYAAFFDGPGGTQTPASVGQAMVDYLAASNANVGGSFVTSQRTDQQVASARSAMAAFYGVEDPREIVFGPNMTSLTLSLSRALAQQWSAGDNIVVTDLDHDANVTPWVLAARDRGVEVRRAAFDPETCLLEPDAVAQLLDSKTKLVATTWASNAVGALVDVREMARVVHSVGAFYWIDAVHVAPHCLIDIPAIGCDFLVSSPYKYFGPHSGVVWGRYELLCELEAYKVRPAPALPPGKFETGTQSFEAMAGVEACVEYLASLGDASGAPLRERLQRAYELLMRHENRLAVRFLDGAAEINGVEVYGPGRDRVEDRVPTFAIAIAGKKPDEVAAFLGERGMFVWSGHYYAISVMERLGLLDSGGLVRVGFVHYNTEAEVDRLLAALAEVAG